MPTSSTATTPSPVSLKNRDSARGGSGPRTISSRKPRPPMSSASARKYAQRTRCSVRVGPEAPYASVGGGAATPTPNVQTPETTWPSDESACQRTVYAPLGNALSVVVITCGSALERVTPETTVPSAERTL